MKIISLTIELNVYCAVWECTVCLSTMLDLHMVKSHVYMLTCPFGNMQHNFRSKQKGVGRNLVKTHNFLQDVKQTVNLYIYMCVHMWTHSMDRLWVQSECMIDTLSVQMEHMA